MIVIVPRGRLGDLFEGVIYIRVRSSENGASIGLIVPRLV